MVRIEWTDRSLEDLKDIYNYIARDSKSYANLFVQKIYKKVQKLKEFPKLGRLVPELSIPSVREIIFQNYRIIYRTMNDYIEIITVFHGSRLLKL
ncbi:MAG: type II toxin-antitoxin system RelE/ParE family toxin [Candidatus Lokiarchaeota archaeon]